METEWIYGLIGGLLIGSAAALLLWVNGRIMGASGLVGGLIDGSGRNNARERIFFVAGLVGVPLIIALFRGAPASTVTSNIGVLIIAGLLVGVGTRLANGCTSGHGVCGISRFSPRGIMATLIYLVSGVLIVAVFRHILGVI
ncbi:MAG: YeeE/YedE family protein [Mangrovicoccus sp.]